VTAGTKVTIIDETGERTAKAAQLSGMPGLLFRRNSVNGRVEVLPRAGVGIQLNSLLHG
jgi:2,3,4,5-tetrahydropyridine-2-carboxylate N-succinyltransferase